MDNGMVARRTFRRSVAGLLIRLIIVMFCLAAWNCPIVMAQDTTAAGKNDCNDVDHPPALKAIKMMAGAYSAEATQKTVEGLVVVCITVDAPELVQSTIDAAKKWEFEPPAKAPVITHVETRYSLSGVCPDGSSDAGEITVGMRPDLEGGRTDVVKLLGSVSRPLPDDPEISRSQRRRGQLYLSLVVNPDGSVTDVRVVKSLDELLDRLALETVRTWRFNVSIGGKPTRFFLTLSYRIPCFDRQ
jgi:TonB family protein